MSSGEFLKSANVSYESSGSNDICKLCSKFTKGAFDLSDHVSCLSVKISGTDRCAPLVQRLRFPKQKSTYQPVSLDNRRPSVPTAFRCRRFSESSAAVYQNSAARPTLKPPRFNETVGDHPVAEGWRGTFSRASNAASTLMAATKPARAPAPVAPFTQ